MARRTKGVVRRIRRGKATIDLEIGGSLVWPTKTLKIGDKVIIGYDYTTMKLRNVWLEEEFENARLAETAYDEGEDDEEHIVILLKD